MKTKIELFEELACIGCYWYDPIQFRSHLTAKTV